MRIKKEFMIEMRIITIAVVIIALLQLLVFYGNMTGYVVYSPGDYRQVIDIDVNQNTSYIFKTDEKGLLESLRLSGYFEGDSAQVRLYEGVVYSYGYENINNSAILVSDGSGEINLEFRYGNISGYDDNNDGIVFKESAVDFIIGGLFNFEADYSKVCTKYTITNLDENLTDELCYGSLECCSFLNLESSDSDWNSSLYLNYGKYGSGHNNTVDAQIVYYDVSLNESDLHSNIYNSEVKRLSAVFTDRIYFENVCVESCSLPLYDEGSYNLDIFVNGLLHISNVNYSLTDNSSVVANASTTETVRQYSAVIGKPVKWEKKVKVDVEKNKVLNSLEINLPAIAGNISVKKIDAETGIEKKIEANVSNEKEIKEIEPIVSITGDVVAEIDEIDENPNVTVDIKEQIKDDDEVIVEYYTEAPYAEEVEVSDKEKEVTVIGPDSVHYSDVLAFSDLPSEVLDSRSIKLYWIVNGTRQNAEFEAFDSDENGLYDYIEWVVPSLSNQTYEIILITKALHLDENRTVIADVYEYVKELDNNYTLIGQNQYLRVTFEKNLTNEKDITVYARSNGSASVEVYTQDSELLIATIENISVSDYYKTYLTSLVGSYDTFDLKVIDSAVEFDYVVDPTLGEDINISVILNTTNISLNDTNQNLTGYVEYNYSGSNNISFRYNWYKDGVLNATTLITDGLVAYWPLNNDTYDYWRDNNGTNTNGAAQAEGKVGNAYRFNGSNYIIVNDKAELDITGNITISAWIKPNGSMQPLTARIIFKGDGDSGTWAYGLSYNSTGSTPGDRMRFMIKSGSNVYQARSTSSVLSNRWYHIVGVYNGSHVALYIDNVLENISVASGALSNVGNLGIGAQVVGTTQYFFNGTIDELMVFNRSLNASEISQLYLGGLAGGHTLHSDLTTKGDNWTLGVKAGDYLNWSSEVNSSGLTIQNKIPDVNSVVLNSTNPLTNDTNQNLTGYVTATDDDNDNITLAYNWYKDGVLNATTLIRDGLVAYLPFNNDSFDYWGNNNGTIYGGTQLNNSNGIIGGAYKFDGNGDYIRVPYTSSIDTSSVFTISFWLKPASLTGDRRWIIGNRKSDTGIEGSAIECNHINASVNCFDAGGPSTSFNYLTDTNYHHFVLTYNSSGNFTLYVDGVKNATTTGTTSANTNPWYIGRDPEFNTRDFNGTIDEVMLFNRTLSASEVSQLYWGELTGGHTLHSNLTSINDNWTLGVKAGDYLDWSSETNSSSIKISSAAYIVTSPPFGIKFVRADNTSIDSTQTGSSGIVSVLVGRNATSGNYSALLTLNFTSDLNLSMIVTDINWTTKKSLLHNSSGISGIINRSLLIPKVVSSGSVYVCPNATSLADINNTCSDKTTIHSDQSNVMTLSSVSYDGENYYLVTGITGTGGGENTLPNITWVILNSTNPLTNDTNQNLTGYVTATDEDGDNITYAYSWYRNGTLNATTLITDGLVAYWPLNNDTLDYYGSNDGTCTNCPASNISDYKVGASYTFNATNVVVKEEFNQSVYTNQATILVWAKRFGNAGANNRVLVSTQPSGGSTGFSLYHDGGSDGYKAIIKASGAWTDCWIKSTTGFTSDLNNWAHLGMVYNGSAVKLYRNGVLLGTDYCTGGNIQFITGANYTLGATYSNSDFTSYFNGTMDEAMIFNRSLSASEIEMLYLGSNWSGHTMDSSRTIVGDNWTLGVKAADYLNWSSEVNSSTLTILDALPNLTSVVLNSTNPLTDDPDQNLTCYANITDDDNTNVYANYSWYRNGIFNFSGQSSSLTQSTLNLISTLYHENTTRGDVWNCLVIAYDGSEYGLSWVNTTITIQGHAPNITSVVLNSTNPLTNDTNQNLSSYVNATDADNDNITFAYKWYRNGTLNATTLITDGLVVYWPLNNDTLDYYGSNDMSCTECPVLNNSGGMLSGAYQFDGINDYSKKENFSQSIYTDKLTVSVWFKRLKNRLNSNRIIVSTQGYDGVSKGFSLYHDWGSAGYKAIVKESDTWGNCYVNSTTSFTSDLNNWVHLAMVYNGSNLTLYRNGVYLNQDSCVGGNIEFSSYTNYSLGGLPSDATSYFNGTIDEVMIFNRSLSASEILLLYDGSRYGATINASQTVRGDNWTLGVKAGDYFAWSSEVNSSGLIILNALPNVTSVTLNSTDTFSNYTDQNLTCYANITDIDGDNVYANYSWYRNGTFNFSGQSTSFTQGTWKLVSTLVSGNLTLGDNWKCSVKGYDGADYGADWTNSSNLTIREPLFANGSGTAGDPYQINSWTRLNNIRVSLSASYILTANLSSSDSDYIGLGDSWTPIGSDAVGSQFTGNFNGSNNTISNLTINRPSSDEVGLFGYTTGNISNVRLVSVNISGNTYVGGITGYQEAGIISNCSSTGNVSGAAYVGGLAGYILGGTISNSVSSNIVYGSGFWVGGLVGGSSGTISNSVSSGNVSGSYYVGGISGSQEDGTISNCSSTGSVTGPGDIGGLVGLKSAGVISNSYSTGSVFGTQAADEIGGLVGRHDGGEISNSYSIINGTINGTSNVGALVGSQISATISNCSSIVETSAVVMGSSNLGFVGSNSGGTISNSYLTIRNTTFGNITFLTWNVTGTGNILGNITISNNSAYVNNAQAGLNKSANITLIGLSTSYVNPRIYRDGTNICNETTSPSCWNFTSLNAGTVKFNVSSWSNYSIGEVPNSAPNVTSVILNSTDPSLNDTNQNLTAYWIASDLDSDIIYNVTDWRVNGTSIAIVNMPFEIGSLNGNSSGVPNGTKDYSTFRRNATIINATWNSTGGYDGFGAYSFDGKDDYIEIASIGALEEFSVSGWFKQIGTGNQKWIGISEQDNTKTTFIGSGNTLEYNKYDFAVNATGVNSIEVTDNEWHHYVLVYSGVNGRLYRDGVLKAVSDITAFTYSNAKVHIGKRAWLSSGYFNGTIDNVQIWNKALSAEQVLKLYQNRTDFIVNKQLSEGDNWTVCVTPSDRTQDGNQLCSNSVIVPLVSNNIPSVSNLVLNSTDPTKNNTNQNLTAYWIVSDLDWQNVTNVTDWRINGTSITVVNLPFEGGSTLKTTKDYSTYNNTILVAGAEWDSAGGHDGSGAYQFDGFSSFMNVGPDNLSNGWNSISICTWIKPIFSKDYAGIFCSRNSGNLLGLATSEASSRKINFYYKNDSSSGSLQSSSLTGNVWYHICGVYSVGQPVKMYINGVLNVTREANLSIGSLKQDDTFRVGWDDYDSSRKLNGTIDDIKVYNRELSAEQILVLYENRTDLIVSNETNSNENWSICVTPNDRTEDGNQTCSTGLIIQEPNLAPNITSVILNATTSQNTSNDNLTGYVTASDADNDNITFAYNWYRNGTLNATTLITDGLVAYYPFNNDTLDYYGSNDGVNNGSTQSSGKVGNAYDFDGVNDNINCGNSSTLRGTNHTTISVWFKPKGNTSSNQDVVSKRRGDLVYGEYVIQYKSTNKISFQVENTTTTVSVASDSAISANQWYHVVGVYDYPYAYLYVNSQLQSTVGNLSEGIHSTSYPLTIGTESDRNDYYFNGSIDEVMLFNRSLNASEVSQLYWGGLVGGHTLHSNLTTVGDNWTLGVKAADYSVWSSETNSSSIQIIAGCGDGICNNGENCGTCGTDCGCSTGYSCANNTCVLDDDGGDGGCVPNCDCASSTCSGSTCSNRCGGECSGTKTTGTCCTDSSWTPDASTKCSGESFTQTSNCGNTKTATGTKTDGTCCLATSWSPDASTVCTGTTFKQTSNCLTTQSSTGTKQPDCGLRKCGTSPNGCGTCGSCYDICDGKNVYLQTCSDGSCTKGDLKQSCAYGCSSSVCTSQCLTSSDCANAKKCKTGASCVGGVCSYSGDLTCSNKCVGTEFNYNGACSLSNGLCAYSTQICDDGKVCTDDSCSASGCAYTPRSGSCGTNLKNDCPGGGFASCTKTCSNGECGDCTPICPDPCENVDCGELSTKCSDGSTKSCSATCKTGSCSCSITCPGEKPIEIEEEPENEEQESVITCVNITKGIENRQISAQVTDVVDENLIPKGYSVLMKPFKMECSSEDLEFTIAIPENYEDVKVLKCKGKECSAEKVDYVTELWCGGKLSDTIRETRTLNLELMPVQIKETKFNVTEIKNSIESGNNKVKFAGEFEGLVTIKMPSTAVEQANNPYLEIVGTPIVLEFDKSITNDLTSEITIPYVLTGKYDESSLAIYAKNNEDWDYLDSTIDYENKLIKTITDVSKYLDGENKATFAVMGLLETENYNSTLNKVYYPEKGTNDMIIFVHGIMSSPKTYQAMIDDIRLTKQPIAVYTFSYSFSSSIDKAAEDFKEFLDKETNNYENIYIIAHSAGGLVTQQMLYNGFQDNDSYINKVKKVILMASPNEGSPVAGVYKNLFKTLVNEKSEYPLFNINSKFIEELVKGRIVNRVPGVEYYVVAGTKPYELNIPIFDNNKETDEEYQKSDGVVTTKSAQHVGESYINSRCENYWEVYLTHNELVNDPLSRKIVESIIAKDILNVDTLLGNSKYFNIEIKNCDPNELYVVIGKKTSTNLTSLYTCSCGNGRCDSGESNSNCPEDCGMFFSNVKNNAVLEITDYILGIMLAIFFILKAVEHINLVLYARKNKKMIVKDFQRLYSLTDETIKNKQMVKADSYFKRIKKIMSMIRYIRSGKELMKLKTKFNSIKNSLKSLESKDVELYREQLALETARCRKQKIIHPKKIEEIAKKEKIKKHKPKPGMISIMWGAVELKGYALYKDIFGGSVKQRIRNLSKLVERHKKESDKIGHIDTKKQVRLFLLYSDVYSKLLYSKLGLKEKQILSNSLKNVYYELKSLENKKLLIVSSHEKEKTEKPAKKNYYLLAIKQNLKKILARKPKRISEYIGIEEVKDRLRKYDVTPNKQKDDLEIRYKQILEKAGKRLDVEEQLRLFTEYSKLYSDLSESCLNHSDIIGLSNKLKGVYRKIKDSLVANEKNKEQKNKNGYVWLKDIFVGKPKTNVKDINVKDEKESLEEHIFSVKKQKDDLAREYNKFIGKVKKIKKKINYFRISEIFPKMPKSISEDVMFKERKGRLENYDVNINRQKEDLTRRYERLKGKANEKLDAGKQIELFMDYSKLYSDLSESYLDNKDIKELSNKMEIVYKNIKVNLKESVSEPKQLIESGVIVEEKVEKPKKKHDYFGLKKIFTKKPKSISQEIKTKEAKEKLEKYDVSAKKQKEDLTRRYERLKGKANEKLDAGKQIELFMDYSKLYSDLSESCLEYADIRDLSNKLKELYKRLRNYKNS